MTKAFPNVIIKESPTDPQPLSPGMRPVKPLNDGKSWREASGQRRLIGAPRGGWPEFDKEGKMVKRRTDSGPVKTVVPKGHEVVCSECSTFAGLGEEFVSATFGTCGVCGEAGQGLMVIEFPRYQALVGRIDLETE